MSKALGLTPSSSGEKKRKGEERGGKGKEGEGKGEEKREGKRTDCHFSPSVFPISKRVSRFYSAALYLP
jgi:hypothetical protein